MRKAHFFIIVTQIGILCTGVRQWHFLALSAKNAAVQDPRFNSLAGKSRCLLRFQK